jgi:hypothetical protein
VPSPDRPLGGAEIRAHVAEVAAELPREGPQHVLVLVGGALLAWHDLRDTTRDVDSVRRLDQDLRTAVGRVARHRDLSPAWINDDAAGFRPATFRDQDCEILLNEPRLLVLGAPLDQVFLMKLYRVDAQDYEDMVTLWPLCGFGSPEEVAALFLQAYPHAPEDPHLADMIRDIATRSEPPG